MQAIKTIICHMNDTLEEAEVYYRDYIRYKDDVPKLANTAIDMAKAHLELYMKWHSTVALIISEYRSTNGEPPAEMKAIWNYEHERLTDQFNELKYKVQNV